MPAKILQQLTVIREEPTHSVDEGALNTPVVTRQPLARHAGSFKGEEWEALLEAIRRNRQALDSQESDVE